MPFKVMLQEPSAQSKASTDQPWHYLESLESSQIRNHSPFLQTVSLPTPRYQNSY